MEVIKRLRNAIAELKETPTEYGFEVDIHSEVDSSFMHHNPFAPGEFFSEWLSE